jgi:hypothetical protein
MKMPVKIFAGTVLAFFVLFGCDFGTSTDNGALKGDKDTGSETLSDSKLPAPDAVPQPYDPTRITISDGVKKWMEEQLAFGSKEKREVLIVDTYPMEEIQIEPYPGKTTSIEGEMAYYINGQKVTSEEYEQHISDWKKEYDKKYEEARRNLRYLPLSDKVLVTAAEIAELIKNYDGLAIKFSGEIIDEGILE